MAVRDLLSVTVQLVVARGPRLGTAHVSDVSTTRDITSGIDTALEKPLREDVMVAVWSVVKAPAFAVNEMDVFESGTVTFFGGTNMGLLLDKETATPPV